MKILYTVLLFPVTILLNAQISTTRMNDLKLGMTLSEAESKTGQSLELSKGEEDWAYNTKIIQKGTEFILRFIENSGDDDSIHYSLYEIETSSENIKTLSKIGVGNTLDDLWKAYKNYNISVWKSWDSETETYSERERIFQLEDLDAGTVLYFYLRNNKIYKISLNYFEGC